MRKKTGIVLIAALLLCLAFGVRTVTFVQAETLTETKDITFASIDCWEYENDILYYCEITVKEDAFCDTDGGIIEYRMAKQGAQYAYLQEYVSVRLDDGGWRTVKEIAADTDAYTYIDTGTPYWQVKAPVVLFGQSTKKIRLYFNKGFVAGVQSVGVKLSKGLYVNVGDVRYELPETVELEHTERGWTVKYDTREEPLGISAVTGWSDRNGEWKVCDVYFSRDILLKSEGVPFGYYDVMDKSTCFFLQSLFLINGKSMWEINRTTDVDTWSFTGFPYDINEKDGDASSGWRTYDGEHYAYRTPVLIYVGAANYVQIRIHENYLETLGDELKITFKEGKYATRVQKNENGTMESVEYTFGTAFTVTKNGGNEWSPSGEWTPYKATAEVIERKDIDFDAIEYDTLYVRSVGSINEYGNDILYKGLRVKNQYFVVYFDKPVCNQYIPYASSKKSILESHMNGLSLTQGQVDALYDYRIDLALNNHIKIDGLTIAEMKAREIINGESAVRVDFSGTSGAVESITVYLSAESLSWLAPYVSHTLEITAGFRTPLFGEVKQDITFYYDSVTRTWSETDFDAAYEWDSMQETATQSPESKVLSGTEIGIAVGVPVAAVAIASAVVILVLYRKKKAKGIVE